MSVCFGYRSDFTKFVLTMLTLILVISVQDAYSQEKILPGCQYQKTTVLTENTGKWLLEPRFEKARKFHLGFAIVTMDGKEGLIDTNGNFILKPIYHYISWYEQTDAFVVKIGGVNGKWGVVNASDEIVINPIYDMIVEFVSTDDELFFSAHIFTDKMFSTRNPIIDYFDKFGNKLSTAPKIKEESNILRYVIKSDPSTELEGIFDVRNNEFIVKPQFTKLALTSNLECSDLIPVRVGDEVTGVWGFINLKGKILISPRFSYISNFREGLAAVNFDKNKESNWGYINEFGETIISPKFSQAGSFYNGLASVIIDGKCGYIDRKGIFVIPPKYDPAPGNYCIPFSGDIVEVKLNGKWGYIMR